MSAEATVAGSSMLRLGDQTNEARAIISPRAASLRALTVRGIDIVEPSVNALHTPRMSGAVMAPWPNRVEDATWWHNGRMQKLTMTEPEFGNANHGLLAHDDFDLVERDRTSVTLQARIRQPLGYPFDLDIVVKYEIAKSGIIVTTAVENCGDDSAPVALGAHPYLRIGSIPIDELAVSVQATHAYRLDDRYIPRESFIVAGTHWDLAVPRPIPDSPSHAAFKCETVDGTITHSLHAPHGERVELWADHDYRWTQLYVDHQFPSDDGPRTAIAIEPMTAPPNALRTGEGIKWIAPRARWHASWGIRYVP